MIRLLLTALLSAVVAAFCISCDSPLARSEAELKPWLYEQTPKGSSIEEVFAYVDKQGWYGLQGSDGDTTRNYIRGELGRYRSGLFYTYVTAFWEFGSSNRLNEIRVWKTTDAL